MVAPPKVSLILATYEMPGHLEMVLRALERQSESSFEVQLCDDGSGAETRAVVGAAIARGKLTIHHFWQENKGFRKCRILNEAIRPSLGELLVFLDGDCVPHPDFIRDHWEAREKGRYCAGRRVNLSEEISRGLSKEAVDAGFFDGMSIELFIDGLRGKSQNANRVVRVKSPWLRHWLGFDRIDDMVGCNFSVFRDDLFAINGFDEDYEGYGREDTDVELRLQHLGLRIKSLKGLALQYHVWHPRRAFTPKNDDRLERLKQSKRVRCQNGLVKLTDQEMNR